MLHTLAIALPSFHRMCHALPRRPRAAPIVCFAASKLWVEITPISAVNPSARKGHTMVVLGDVFIMYGGYSNNYFNEEFWFYNTTTNMWLQKMTFVHPVLPDTCTDDVAAGTESVYGQPTRFTTLDGKFGKCRLCFTASSVFV